MSATTTLFRQSLQTTLAAAYGFEFIGGIISPPMRDRKIGCVWLEGKRPMARDGNEAECYFRIRVFELWRQNQGETEQGLNVEAMETSLDKLETTLAPVLLTAARTVPGCDFMVVREVTMDYPGEYVEAQLVLYQRNLSAAGS